MKAYFTKRKFLCTKKLKMDSGEVVFKRDKVYSFDVDDSPTTFSLIDENGDSHEMSINRVRNHHFLFIHELAKLFKNKKI